MTKLKSLLTMSFIAAIACPFAFADSPKALDTTPPAFSETWYQVMIQDMHCGHMHSIQKTVGDEVITESTTSISIRRGPQTVSMRMDQSMRETLDGKPLGFRNVQKMGTADQIIEGVINGDKVKLKSTQYGVSSESEHPFDPECLLSWGQTLEQIKHGLAPGTKFKVKTYEPSMSKDKPLEMEVTVGAKEAVNVLGKERMLIPMSMSLVLGQVPGMEGGVTVDTVAWIDDDHSPVVMTVDLGVMKMKMYQTTKDAALKTGAPPEMFLSTMIASNRDVPDETETVKYKVSIAKDSKAKLPSLPETEMQSFERIDERSGYVTVKRIDWKELQSSSNTKNESPGEVYLSPSPNCDSNDRKIQRLAKKEIKGQDTLADKADALRRFATAYIKHKGLDVGFATASEVVRERHGDCTEHSVFLAALARAVKIPSRGVGGLVGVPNSYRATGADMEFGFHMWTQVYINGKWIDIDAAMRQTDCDVTHIAITLMDLGDNGFMNEIGSLIPILGQLDIEVVEIDGKKVASDE